MGGIRIKNGMTPFRTRSFALKHDHLGEVRSYA